MMRFMSLAGLVATVVLACAPPATAHSGRDANVITKEEIASVQVANLYDVVTRLRPNFLANRGQSTLRGADNGYPKVYLDRSPLGDIQALKTLSPNGIREIRYYNGAEASSKFGLDNTSGAIEVLSDTSR
jgi:hypothetical protein